MLKKYSAQIMMIFAILILLIIMIISPNFRQIAGGVAVFLFGMRFLQSGFKSFTGGKFEQLLQKSTDKTWKSMLFGFSASSIMQSSSLVSIITVSFLSAELITLIQGIGIILGSSIGNTTGIWLLAAFGMNISLGSLGLPLIVIGIICAFTKNKVINGIGNVLAGLGFVFVGIGYMKDGVGSLTQTLDLSQYAVGGFLGVITFTIIGLIVTVIMQSSHATIILVLTMLAAGQISFENSLALTIGANLGTSVTSFIVALTGNKDGKRVGLSDLLMKTIASIVFVIFFYQFMGLNEILAKVLTIPTDNFPLKLALFHTLFNVVGVTIMLLIVNKIIIVLKKVFPNERTNVYGSIYLNKGTIALPDTAIISLIKETRHLYYNTIEVVLESIGLKQSDISGEINFEELKKKIKVVEVEDIDNLYNKKIKVLYGDIIDYAAQAQSSNDPKYARDFQRVKQASRSLVEVVKGMKHLQKNLKRYLRSTNSEIKAQYEDIVKELIDILRSISKFQNSKTTEEKMFRVIEIMRVINENDVMNNGVLDSLIREQKISNEMATSLMNDSGYKNEMFSDLLFSCKIIFNNNISDTITGLDEKREGHWLSENFGLSKKEVAKLVEKSKKDSKRLKQEIKATKNKKKKEELQCELNNLEFFIKTYKHIKK